MCLLMVLAAGCKKETVKYADAGPNKISTADATGEKLIPSGAERVIINKGDLNLQSSDTLPNIKNFYLSALKDLSAAGEEQPNIERGSDEQKMVWNWKGTYNNRDSISIEVNQMTADTFYISVQY